MDLEPEEHFEFKKLAFDARKPMTKFLVEIVRKVIEEKKSDPKNLKIEEKKSDSKNLKKGGN